MKKERLFVCFRMSFRLSSEGIRFLNILVFNDKASSDCATEPRDIGKPRIMSVILILK